MRRAAGRSLCGLPSVISYVPLMDGELARTTFRPLRPHRIYRLRLERDGRGVRLITRGGYNFADRYPWIVEAARKVRQTRFVIDGEAAVLGIDGMAARYPRFVILRQI